MSAARLSPRTAVLVAAALLALLAASAGLATVDLGRLNLPLGLGLAALKAFLVVVYFMGLRASSALVRVVAGASLLWLALLVTLTLSEVLTRVPIALPPR